MYTIIIDKENKNTLELIEQSAPLKAIQKEIVKTI